MIEPDPSHRFSRMKEEDLCVAAPVELRHETSSTQTLSNLSGVTPLEDDDEEESCYHPPSLVLYTYPSDSNSDQQQFIHQLQALLLTHYPGVMMQFADASNPETRRQLQERFCGGDENDDHSSVRSSQSSLSFPALVLDDRVWIPADEPDWHEIVHEYLQHYCSTVFEEETLVSEDASVDHQETKDDDEKYLQHSFATDAALGEDISVDYLEDDDDMEELISYLDMDQGPPGNEEEDSSVSSGEPEADQHPATVTTNYSGDSSVTQWTANRGQSLRTITTEASHPETTEKTNIPNKETMMSESIQPTPPLHVVSEPTSNFPHQVSMASTGPTIPTVRIVGAVQMRHQRWITLPGGTKVTAADLTRQLMQAIPHRWQNVPTKTESVHSFRGLEGIMIWKRLFGSSDATTKTSQGNDDDTWMEFGLKLLSHGILHDYTPKAKDFRQTYLAVQPLRNMYSLNTLLKWSTNGGPVDADQSCALDSESMLVLLRLSRAMDAIFDRPRHSEAAHHLFQELEEAVCELQTIAVPTEPKLKQVFALNLYNLMVRHAMILVSSNQRKGWVWPTSLEELDRFFLKIGYTIDGSFMSVFAVRTMLFCNENAPTEMDPNALLCTNQESALMKSCITWRGSRSRRDAKSSCIGVGGRWKKDAEFDAEAFYPKALISKDVRLLWSLTWGTNISPVARTIYPDQLDQELQTLAEEYCQKHVTITEGTNVGSITVVLPPLLSWYRFDFGKYAENVLQSIDPYLSKHQQCQIHHAQQFGKLKISLGNTTPSNWQCAFPAVKNLVTLTPLAQRNKSVRESSCSKGVPSTAGSMVTPKMERAAAITSLKQVTPHKKDPQEAAPPTKMPARNATTLPATEPETLRAIGPFESITDLSLYTSSMQHTGNYAKQEEYKSASSSPTNNTHRPTSMYPISLGNEDTKENEVPFHHMPTKLHLQPSPIKNLFTEIEVNGLGTAGTPICNIPALSMPPVKENEIETGGFPLKFTRLYPITDQDFCYSQSSESGGENVCLLNRRWMDLTQPTLGTRQASLGDSLLLPPGSDRPFPMTEPNHTEYNIQPPKLTTLCHNATESSIELEDSEGGQSWYFRSDVSAITFGSEFEALLRMNSFPQLVPSPGGEAPYSSDRIHYSQFYPSIGGYP